jgi:hypothetical protein
MACLNFRFEGTHDDNIDKGAQLETKNGLAEAENHPPIALCLVKWPPILKNNDSA